MNQSRRLSPFVICVVPVFLGYTFLVFMLAAYGGPYVEQLDDQIGEVIAKRASGFEAAGHTAEAIEAYSRALHAKFDDPTQYTVTSTRFVDFLMRERRYELAVTVAADTLKIHPVAWRSYDQLVASLFSLGKPAEAEAAANKWLTMAQQQRNTDQATWATAAIARSRLEARKQDR